MPPLVQEIIVTLVALAAAGYVVRRMIEAIRPQPRESGCEACAMHAEAGERAPTPAEPARVSKPPSM